MLSYLRSGTGSQDFDLYIVDHGYAATDGSQSTLPFSEYNARTPASCGNYYDFFLPEGVAPQNTTLELFFRYDRTADCAVAINNSNICMGATPTPEVVPVFW